MPNANEPNEYPDTVQEDAQLRATYEEAKRALTAEQLRRFEIEEPMFPFEDVLAELEALHREAQHKEAS